MVEQLECIGEGYFITFPSFFLGRLMGIMKRYFDKNNSRFNGQDTGNSCREFLDG
jgi:hypothetical protein